MYGIDLNEKIEYSVASLRRFSIGERHVTRVCDFDVLILMLDGVLRFTEDSRDIELRRGEYYIQRAGLSQEGRAVSDSPEYLYVHFNAEWSDSTSALPSRGRFDPDELKERIRRLDQISHAEYTIVEQCAIFYDILSTLYRDRRTGTLADRVAEYIAKNYRDGISLEALSDEMHFSKNHIINCFKKQYGRTPFDYMNELRITHSKRLLKNTTDTLESIALVCGFAKYSYFYKAFKSRVGISPAEFRKCKE